LHAVTRAPPHVSRLSPHRRSRPARRSRLRNRRRTAGHAAEGSAHGSTRACLVRLRSASIAASSASQHPGGSFVATFRRPAACSLASMRGTAFARRRLRAFALDAVAAWASKSQPLARLAVIFAGIAAVPHARGASAAAQKHRAPSSAGPVLQSPPGSVVVVAP
jgi:hypothetical protein